MACEYPECPCQRVCGFTGEQINPAASIYCHAHVHRGHAHVHVHPEMTDDELQHRGIKEHHAHQEDASGPYRYISLTDDADEHYTDWHTPFNDIEWPWLQPESSPRNSPR